MFLKGCNLDSGMYFIRVGKVNKSVINFDEC